MKRILLFLMFASCFLMNLEAEYRPFIEPNKEWTLIQAFPGVDTIYSNPQGMVLPNLTDDYGNQFVVSSKGDTLLHIIYNVAAGVIDIPEGVAILGENLFYGMELGDGTIIHLPSTLVSVGKNALAGFWRLKPDCKCPEYEYDAYFTCAAVQPPTMHELALEDEEFPVVSRCALFVPDESVEAYRQAEGWRKFAAIRGISEFERHKVYNGEYYPEGTKWTEIRLDTLKYDSWYTQVDDQWIPNFETIDYYVKGSFTSSFTDTTYKSVYTDGANWSDSLAFLIFEDKYGIQATVRNPGDGNTTVPGWAYNFSDWEVGNGLWYRDIISANVPSFPAIGYQCYGTIEEIKAGDFGGLLPLTYVEMDGFLIIQGIGVTEWNDGECLFGPVGIYDALKLGGSFARAPRNYRSMLVHFERDGETLYDVWPEPGKTLVNVTTPSVSSEGKDAGVIYDLQGRRLQKAPQKGMYIVNGKKKGAVLP